ncbi:hypothetical protein KIN20_035949 [Parelaphostrongylus tenuis]|uniref:SCP domain-containing protein n=1 Tax=Parelaphostrongylus tenuis TaxID=148309 RepID=A0AAD5RBY4_PARTN|nr:hypothetical protein KIN20_035949 [Parelaphostrongylus tenuis]
MMKPNMSAIGCSLEICQQTTLRMVVVMACFYGEPEMKSRITTTGILSTPKTAPLQLSTTKMATIPQTTSKNECLAKKDENFRNYTLEFHNNIRNGNGTKSMKRSCELEKMADDIVHGCPVNASFEMDSMNYASCSFNNGLGMADITIMASRSGICKGIIRHFMEIQEGKFISVFSIWIDHSTKCVVRWLFTGFMWEFNSEACGRPWRAFTARLNHIEEMAIA